MLLDARTLDLAVHAVGQDVVADDVLAAVVLVVSPGLDAVDEVVLQDDAGTAFVVVQPPAAAAVAVVGVHVVNHVVADGGAVSQAQRVHAAHVAQHAPAQVMDVVELDLVLHRDRRRVAPAPADRDARVELVADVVVRHLVVAAVADPHADGAVVDAGGAVDDVVVADDVAGLRVRFREVDARCRRSSRRRRRGRPANTAGRGSRGSRGGTRRRECRRASPRSPRWRRCGPRRPGSPPEW